MQITDECRAFAHSVRYRDGMLRAWLGKRTSYRPEDVPAHIQVPTNEERSRAERIDFIARPLALGSPYLAYMGPDYRHVQTFIGEPLGTVVQFTRRRHRGWLSDVCGSFWVRGIDGRMYHGRHWGPGIYCRMRLAKRQRP